MVEIREAVEKDNDALTELGKKSPMGTNLVLGVDAPDYFARSRPFRDWHVYVATDNGVIIGSAAFAINDTHVAGEKLRAAYEYGFIVDPQYRRKGIAEKLQKHIEHVASDENVDLLHLIITENNLPSMNFFSKMGFQKVKDCATFSLMAYKKHKIAEEAIIRSMEETDVAAVANLLNTTYRDYDFFTPFKPENLLDYIKRIPHFTLQNIVVLDDGKRVRACLGYWDYNKIRKYIVERLNWRLQAQTFLIRLVGLFTKMPHIPKPGEPLLSYNLTTMAYEDPENITELLKHVVNTAVENKIDFIHIPVDPESPVAAVLSQFRHTKIKLHFFAKSFKQEILPNLRERKLYIDISEM